MATLSSKDLHKYLCDKGATRKLYVGTTWDEAREVGEKYNIMYTILKVLLHEGTVKRNFVVSKASSLIFDHSNFMTDMEKSQLVCTYPFHKITFVV